MTINPNKLFAAKLGQVWDRDELEFHFTSIYGGVAWPGKHPGFAVVVAKSRFYNDIYLLAESYSEDMLVLVRQCGVLNYKYHPAVWFGDTTNKAAARFINEMNKKYECSQQFSLTSTQMLDMGQELYQFILPKLKELLDKERKQLHLKSSKIRDHLITVESDEIAIMDLGEYPAIEALAFAVLELKRDGGRGRMDLEQWRALKAKYNY